MAGELARRETQLAGARSQYNLARPSDEDRMFHRKATVEALDKLIASITGHSKPPPRSMATTYKPKGSDDERKLRIIEQQNDPLEPPRHRYQKPRPFDDGSLVLATQATRAPILRPAPKKLTKEQKQEWEIPQSVSNWKNGRGFLIDLERRSSQTPSTSASPNVSKQAALAAALSEASDELADEKSKSGSKQLKLREKLRAQREANQREATSNESESEDLFDTRLFHAASRKHHEIYDSTFFTNAKRSKTTEAVRFQRGSS